MPFKIVAIRYNTRLTTIVQKQSAKASCGIDRRTSVRRTFMSFTSAKGVPLMVAFKWGTGISPQESDQAVRRVIKHQLPSSEPGISAHGSHCIQGHYRGAASIFQFCATLAEPAQYAVAIGSKLPGKMH